MAAYQRLTGFKPIGNHVTLVALLLAPLLQKCDRCDGAGMIADEADPRADCPECGGLGAVRTVSEAVFEATRRRIAAEYPATA